MRALWKNKGKQILDKEIRKKVILSKLAYAKELCVCNVNWEKMLKDNDWEY